GRARSATGREHRAEPLRPVNSDGSPSADDAGHGNLRHERRRAAGSARRRIVLVGHAADHYEWRRDARDVFLATTALRKLIVESGHWIPRGSRIQFSTASFPSEK